MNTGDAHARCVINERHTCADVRVIHILSGYKSRTQYQSCISQLLVSYLKNI